MDLSSKTDVNQGELKIEKQELKKKKIKLLSIFVLPNYEKYFVLFLFISAIFLNY